MSKTERPDLPHYVQSIIHPGGHARVDGVPAILSEPLPLTKERRRPDLYEFLGKTPQERAIAVAKKVIPGQDHLAQSLRDRRRSIFEYLVLYLQASTFDGNYGEPMGKGIGIARRPYLAPTGFPVGWQVKMEPEVGSFCFKEQYRWDTYFQNQFLLLIGARDLALGQLMNLVEAYDDYLRIPNALTTEFLSHPQPPLEAFIAHDLLKAGVERGKWFDQTMRVVGDDLRSEWFDYRSGRIHPRQDEEFYQEYGPYLSRYVSIHFHPLLVGCQDGKDHHWLTAAYGEDYLPVQLNSILWANIGILKDYYESIGDQETAAKLAAVHQTMKDQINRLMWVEDDKWTGFRNYSMGSGGDAGRRLEKGPIYYGDMAAEVWPLFVGLATPDQAEVTLHNLRTYYQGDIGLASTNPTFVPGLITPARLEGWSLQWEVNAWPPLMMVAVDGLLNYSEGDDEFYRFAVELQRNWVSHLEQKFWQEEADPGILRPAFHEKAPYDTRVKLDKGFYGNLPGFGWTIASYAVFLNRLVADGQIHDS
jgi:hypothetical protein